MENRELAKRDGKRETGLDVRRESDPFLSLQSEMNRMFETFFERPFGMRSGEGFGAFAPSAFAPGAYAPSAFAPSAFSPGSFAPSIDVYETEKEIRVDVDLPGMEEKDIDITLANNVLTISGKKETEGTREGKSYYRHERSYGSFRRSIELSDQVDEEHIDATYQKGILKIVLPKMDQSVITRKRIQIKKG